MINNDKYVFWCSILLFLIALTQPTYCIESQGCGDYFSGFALFILGWLGMLLGHSAICWLANPFLILAWICFDKDRSWSLLFSVLALGFSIAFLSFKQVLINEAGQYGNVVGYALGYWLWVSSIFVLCAGNMIAVRKSFLKSNIYL